MMSVVPIGRDQMCLAFGFRYTFINQISPLPSAKTQLGVWLIKDLHRVSDNVAELTYTAFVYLSVFPLIDSIVSTVRDV